MPHRVRYDKNIAGKIKLFKVHICLIFIIHSFKSKEIISGDQSAFCPYLSVMQSMTQLYSRVL